MIGPICRNIMLLSLKSEPVTGTPADLQTGSDLAETLKAHSAECVGMAANMIGIRKRIIAVSVGGVPLVMYNPVITQKTGVYEAEEGCLSLSGKRRTKRFRRITVRWQDAAMQPQERQFSGWLAQIIQHEADHLEGILI